MSNTVQLDPSLTINEIVSQHPATAACFNRFGFDTCCGGGVTVQEAARRDGVDLDAVLADLRRALEQG